jgi:hypothetical protein
VVRKDRTVGDVGEEAVPEIRVRKKRGCDDSTREVNEHDEEVRIAPPRPGPLTASLGSNSEQPVHVLFWKSIAPRRVTRVRVTCTTKGCGSEDGNVFTMPNTFNMV